MKTKLFIPFLTLFLLVNHTSVATELTNTNDPEKDKILITVLNYMLTRGHFVEKQLDDTFSLEVFENFIDGLDPSKRYFTQEDIDIFSKYKYRIDNQIRESDLSFYHLVYEMFLQKIKSAKNYYGNILNNPFDYKKRESIDIDYEY